MKLKAIPSSAKTGFLTLLDKVEADKVVKQYVMLDRAAIYPLEDGMPELTEESLLAVMDVPMDKREGWHVDRALLSERMLAMVQDDNEEEPELRAGEVGYGFNGHSLLTTWKGEQAYFFHKEYLKPLDGIKDVRYMRMKLRTVDGSAYIVVLNGMQHVATIAPIARIADERVCKELIHAGEIAGKMQAENEYERNAN